MNQQLQAARIKHLAFKSKVRALLYGADVTADVLVSETDCALGKWILTIGRPMFSHYPEMAALELAHTRLHEKANLLVALCQNNKYEEAQAKMPQIEQISEEMTAFLDRIDQRIASGN